MRSERERRNLDAMVAFTSTIAAFMTLWVGLPAVLIYAASTVVLLVKAKRTPWPSATGGSDG